MGRPPRFPVEDKLRIVLSVLSGEMTIVEAARRNQTSEQSVGRWKQQFLEGGKAGLAEGGRVVDNARDRALLEQIDEMYERVEHAWNSHSFEPSWSFQQMRDFGFSDSGVPPAEPQLELQPSNASTSQSDTGGSATTDTTGTNTQDNKMLSQMGHIELSY